MKVDVNIDIDIDIYVDIDMDIDSDRAVSMNSGVLYKRCLARLERVWVDI